MESNVQVAGNLNTPVYEWPLKAGIGLIVMAPVAYGLRLAGWRGVGRLRALFGLLRFIGPTRFLIGGAVALIFAVAVRQARIARRRDLEIAPDRFAILDRQGRHEFEDVEVTDLAFRSRSAPTGTVRHQRGQATLWVDGREGPDRLELDWHYPDLDHDPLAGFLGRIADRLHARAVKAIDTGLTIEGDGWELSRLGLQVGHAFEVIPFRSIAQAEYHDGQLMVWLAGQVEPSVKITEGSKNDAILHAILIERMSPRSLDGPFDDPSSGGFGRVLFERRATLTDKLGLWLVCLILAALLSAVAIFAIRGSRPVVKGVVVSAIVASVCSPAWIRQKSRFRFHERGVIQAGVLGVRELPFEDLGEVRFRSESNQQLLRVSFRPIPDRGRKIVTLTLKPTDEALETIRAYVPAERIFR